MFRPENRRETIGMLLGLAVLALGIGVQLFTFSIASGIVANPRGYIESQIPPTAQPLAGPRASFRWTADGRSTSFTDGSTQGAAPIVAWQWDFGDGASSSERNPNHLYTRNGTYFVRLTVRDGNNKESSAISNVQVFPGAQAGGNSTVDVGDLATSFNPLQLNAPLVNLGIAVAAVTAVFFMLLVMWLVGASITKAGWNMVRPRPETVRVRVKPRSLEAEPVTPMGAVADPPPPPA